MVYFVEVLGESTSRDDPGFVLSGLTASSLRLLRGKEIEEC